MFPVTYTVGLGEQGTAQVDVRAMATHAEMFDMFGLQFIAGGPWSAADDAAQARKVVLAEPLARRLFPDGKAVDKTVLVNGQQFQVSGVTRNWDPRPHFHAPIDRDTQSVGFIAAEQLFLPVETAAHRATIGVPTTGNWNCNRAIGYSQPARTVDQWLNGNCIWTLLWVELDSAAEVQRYTQLLRDHAEAQYRSGRFPWPPLSRLYSVTDWLVVLNVVRVEYQMAVMVGFGFLLVCLVNAIGLMLARFHARGAELRLRRALGASRAALFRQCLVETAVIGIAGGVLGVALLAAGVGIQHLILPAGLAGIAGADLPIMGGALLLGAGGTMLAGLYPAWAISRVRDVARQPRGNGRLGSALVTVQIALTLGIVANAVHVSWVYIEAMRQPTGIDERNILSISTRWQNLPPDRPARIEADLAALRSMPGVLDAAGTSAMPLTLDVIGIPQVYVQSPDGKEVIPGGTGSAMYFTDDHGLASFGLQLTAGRWFRPEEIGRGQGTGADVVVITQTLARRLFRGGNPLDRTIYTRDTSKFRVIGVLKTLGSRAGWGDQVIVIPRRYFNGEDVHYVVRAHPGRRDAVLRGVEKLLRDLDSMRIVYPPRTFDRTRSAVFSFNENLATTLLGVCVLLVAVIGLGITGLSQYWLTQRRLLIGICRALGATRGRTLLRFQVEILWIVATGAVAGTALAVVLSHWLTGRYSMPPIELPAVAFGAGVVLLGSQFAVLWPALKASLVPPAIVARGS
jgi:putative ABC transport system permease protein